MLTVTCIHRQLGSESFNDGLARDPDYRLYQGNKLVAVTWLLLMLDGLAAIISF